MSSTVTVSSKSTSTSVGCWCCKQQSNIHELVRVYGKSWNDHAAPRQVCGSCLVGYHIPVVRHTTGKWEFGTVLSYSGSRSRIDHYQYQYLLKFIDDKREWVSVRADPFEAYARHFQPQVEARRARMAVRDPPQQPSTHLVSPNRSEDLRHQDSFQSESREDRSSSEEITSSSDTSEDIFFSTSSSEDFPLVVEYPPKKRARITCSNRSGCLSPGNRKRPGQKGNNISSPAGSRISSVTNISSPTSLSSSSTRYGSTSSTSSSQRIARLWTPREDKLLLDSIAENNNVLCWPKIASDIPGRTGKQCRERYLNHLGPHLKHSGWSALEDATIFRMFALYGSRWSQIVKAIPGRTDNGVKNRFHHLRKRFHRRMRAIPHSKALALLTDHMGKCTPFQNLSPDWFATMEIAARILNKSSNVPMITGDGEYKFGPMDPVKKSVGCGRCGLIVPSKQTGTLVCRQTGWCETCTEASLAISGDLLRAIHLVKKDLKEKAHTTVAQRKYSPSACVL